ncbi:MAG: hypothetical protein WCZ21_06490 [Bacteroidales bacterium]
MEYIQTPRGDIINTFSVQSNKTSPLPFKPEALFSPVSISFLDFTHYQNGKFGKINIKGESSLANASLLAPPKRFYQYFRLKIIVYV